MRTGKYDNEILVSHKRAPGIVARGDMHKAVTTLYHRYRDHDGAQHFGPAIDAVLRLISQATQEQLKAARIVEDKGQEDVLDALERLVCQIPRPNLDDPDLDAAIEFAERAIAAQRKARNGD